MAGYQIGTVCELLGVKPHVLRYWEQELPILSPPKDQDSPSVYSRQELYLLLRIKYQLQEKKFTLAGVQEKLWDEFYSEEKNARAHITAVRNELLLLQGRVREQKKKIEEILDNAPERSI